jgi:hypothetical protein
MFIGSHAISGYYHIANRNQHIFYRGNVMASIRMFDPEQNYPVWLDLSRRTHKYHDICTAGFSMIFT